ncbi:MAG: NAD(P)/FAD-dependent oxidoreductase, partial [Leptospirales bacterium]
MSQNEYDVLLIGGGPGGSTAATHLAKAGKRVLVLDHAKFPRVKVCAGWVTPGALGLLELSPEDYPHTLQPFSGGSVIVDGKYHFTDFGQTASYGIIRNEFDYFLFQRAAAAGAEMRDGVRVKSVDRDEEGVSVETVDGEVFRGKLLIGAGGSGCPVSRKWGERQKNEDIILACEVEVKIGAEKLKQLTPHYGSTELFAEHDFYGYGWYVTKGDFVNIGVGRFKKATPNFNDDKRRFFEMIESLGRIKGIEDQLPDFSGHSYKLYDETPRKLSGDRFMLIGDAGGFATRWAGEGIKPAIQTGIFAARTAIDALKKGACDAASLKGYEDLCRKTYGEQRVDGVARVLNFLPQFVKAGVASQICKRRSLR